jgi:predicted MFS family arabinose efflux permease
MLSLIMLGDLLITMLLTVFADRLGRKNTLSFGALLKLFTGIVFSVSENYALLCLSGIIGVISMSGTEIGPFLSIEQSALTDLCEKHYGQN